MDNEQHEVRRDGRAGGRSGMWRSRWAAVGAAVAMSLGLGSSTGLVSASSPEPSPVLVTIDPCRLTDLRPPSQVGPRGGPLGPGETYEIPVRGANGACTIPDAALGVVANVTVLNSTDGGYLTFFPADGRRPTSSNLNFVAGQPATPNQVTVALSPNGRMRVFNFRGSVDIIVDLVGYTIGHDHDDQYATLGHDHDETYAPIEHIHDDRYYREIEADTRFATRIWAKVGADGILVAGSNVVSSSQLAGEGVGRYEVVLNRDVTLCGYQVTSNRTDAEAVWPQAAGRTGNTDAVLVTLEDDTGAPVNAPFSLSVDC